MNDSQSATGSEPQLKMSQENAQSNYDRMTTRDINKHGSDYELMLNAKMRTPLIDKVKTMTNSLDDEVDGTVGNDQGQGDVCSSIPIQEESSCSSNKGDDVQGKEARKKNVVKIKLTSLKASIHKRTSLNRNID